MGVFAGIAPCNFPGMILLGWMAPICIATGNRLVLKVASFVRQTAMRISELWKEPGLPDGVLNLVTAGRNEAEIFLRHPAIKGVSFVGTSLPLGLVYGHDLRLPVGNRKRGYGRRHQAVQRDGRCLPFVSALLMAYGPGAPGRKFNLATSRSTGRSRPWR
jgi:hypothetical protein